MTGVAAAATDGHSLPGGLLRQVDPDSVPSLVERLIEITGDEEGEKRLSLLDATAEALKAVGGQKVTGWPKLIERLGKDGAAVVREFKGRLGLCITAGPGAPAAAAGRLTFAFGPRPRPFLRPPTGTQ